MLRNVPLALAAFGLVAQAAPADAAGLRIHVDVGHHGGYRDAGPSPWDVGYERGFEDGERHGRRDAHRHRYPDPWRHSRFRDATSGHRSRHGRRAAYQDGYRSGFESAYRRAYRGYGYERAYRGYRYEYDGRHRRRAMRRYDDRRGHRHDGHAEVCYLRH